MASKPHKHILTSVPPVGFELFENGQRFVVEASRPHVSRDGRASAVIDWLSSCRTCGCDIRQQTGVLIRYFNKRCAAHSKWNAGRVTVENVDYARGPEYVAAPPPADATFSGAAQVAAPSAEPHGVTLRGRRGPWLDFEWRGVRRSYHPELAAKLASDGVSAAALAYLASEYDAPEVKAEDLF